MGEVTEATNRDQFIEVSPGVRLRYRWAGNEEGPVVVLSHSLGTDLNLWQQQVDGLGDRYRLLLYDHRGHGESDTPPRPWTMADFGSDAWQLIETLVPGTSVHFCGVSLGGMVGLWLAQHATHRMKSIVAANTSAYTEDPSLLRNRLQVIERKGLPAIADHVLERWFTAEFSERHPEIVDNYRDKLIGTPVESYCATSEAICDLDLRSGLSGMKIPLLVITGHHDRATPPEWGQAIASNAPQAKLVSLPVAHLSNVEAGSGFNKLVRDFLRETEGADE